MSNVDFRPYKRIVQYFWDPEPKNNDSYKSSIWCLGKEYAVAPSKEEVESRVPDFQPSKESIALSNGQGSERSPKRTKVALSSSDYEGAAESRNGGSNIDRDWPNDFLDDFESRMWLTYRSNFPSIKKSQDSNASAAMSLSVRLRSQLVDQGGFTSDTGWGCMIRSGQSLLANALVMLRLGRGETYF
jgi:cysteine protease ATG4